MDGGDGTAWIGGRKKKKVSEKKKKKRTRRTPGRGKISSKLLETARSNALPGMHVRGRDSNQWRSRSFHLMGSGLAVRGGKIPLARLSDGKREQPGHTKHAHARILFFFLEVGWSADN